MHLTNVFQQESSSKYVLISFSDFIIKINSLYFLKLFFFHFCFSDCGTYTCLFVKYISNRVFEGIGVSPSAGQLPYLQGIGTGWPLSSLLTQPFFDSLITLGISAIFIPRLQVTTGTKNLWAWAKSLLRICKGKNWPKTSSRTYKVWPSQFSGKARKATGRRMRMGDFPTPLF